MTEPVKVEHKSGVAVVMLNRSEAFNAFDMRTIAGLADALVGLAADSTVRGVVITGSGKAFCAGGDLKWALSFENGPPAAFHELAARFHLAVTEIRRMPKPVIAAVNGVAAGGGFSLALACDFRVLAKSAVLKQAYSSNGLCIDGGGTFTLPRLAGFSRALEILTFDQPISSDQALSWGLATKVVVDGQALSAGVEMAVSMAGNALHAFGVAKQLLTDSFDTSFETQIERERQALSACAGHSEGKESLMAFAQKRKPKFC